jgi:hypothetical protein
MIQGHVQRYQQNSDRTSRFQIVPARTSRFQIVPARTSRFQIVPADFRSYQHVPAELKRYQHTTHHQQWVISVKARAPAKQRFETFLPQLSGTVPYGSLEIVQKTYLGYGIWGILGVWPIKSQHKTHFFFYLSRECAKSKKRNRFEPAADLFRPHLNRVDNISPLAHLPSTRQGTTSEYINHLKNKIRFIKPFSLSTTSTDRVPEAHGGPRSPRCAVGPYGLPNQLTFNSQAPGPCLHYSFTTVCRMLCRTFGRRGLMNTKTNKKKQLRFLFSE